MSRYLNGQDSATHFGGLRNAGFATGMVRTGSARGGLSNHARLAYSAPVSLERTWLYERPSVGSIRHGYLIHSNQVTVIDTQNSDWARVRYARPGKAPIEAWLQKQDIAH